MTDTKRKPKYGKDFFARYIVAIVLASVIGTLIGAGYASVDYMTSEYRRDVGFEGGGSATNVPLGLTKEEVIEWDKSNSLKWRKAKIESGEWNQAKYDKFLELDGKYGNYFRQEIQWDRTCNFGGLSGECQGANRVVDSLWWGWFISLNMVWLFPALYVVVWAFRRVFGRSVEAQ